MRRALLACLLLTACPRRIDFGPKGEIKSADELLAAVRAAETQVFSVKGEAKIKIESPQAKGVVTLFMAVTHPSLIHLESLDFFGKPQAVLISDGQTFGLFQAQEGKFYRGPASPQNISRFLPIVLPPEELTALMLGRAPRIPHEQAALSIDEEKKLYRLVLTKGQVTQTLGIEPRLHRVVSSQVRGLSAYDLAFETLEEVKGVTYPRKVVLTAPAASTTLELLYKDVEVNGEQDLTLFDQAPLPNVPIVEVDEAGKPREAAGP